MLSRYHTMMSERGFDWGDDWEGLAKTLMKYVGFCDPQAILDAVWSPRAAEDPIGFLLESLPDPLPPGVVISDGQGLRTADPLPLWLVDTVFECLVIHVGQDGTATRISEHRVSGVDPVVRVDGGELRVAEVRPHGLLHLTSNEIVRWSVTDERGGGWFADGSLHKFGWRNHPFFHAKETSLRVPEGAMTVVAARGCEFDTRTESVSVARGAEHRVSLTPQRLYDPASIGWYGGDLHVHMNYFGNDVGKPSDAQLMQIGEGLHLMNLVAGNALTSFIYDRECFETYLGRDLPWSDHHTVARWGVEYRNDLFGHFHALNPQSTPTRFYTGHARSDQPQDWPPNSVAAAELRGLGATIGYTHPVQVPLDDEGTLDEIFSESRSVRSCDARALVVDAALGLVDSVDVGTNGDVHGTAHLYHRLLGCGLKIAVTAGTDTMLPLSRLWPLSNPPGWFRAYANLSGSPLTVQSWQQAVRDCRTFITNGPWLEFSVNGAGIGETINLGTPGSVEIRAGFRGGGVERIDIVGADGVLESHRFTDGGESGRIETEIAVSRPTWVAAVAHGPENSRVPGPHVYAHTSPVWVNVSHQSVSRGEDAEWCLNWVDKFEAFTRRHGVFATPNQLADLLADLSQSRTFYRQVGVG